MDIKELENKLNSFDKNTRLDALKTLCEKVDKGEIKEIKKTNFVNLHCHTFFSFNAYGYSPEHIVWRAFREGLEAVGIVDFDTLDGVDEVLQSGRILGIRTSAGVESRVFVKEYSDKVINSPKEPGIFYFEGIGFYKKPTPGSKADSILSQMGTIAKQRNLTMIDRINNFLQDIKIDYDRDVLSLTPNGNATERHILASLDRKAKEVFGKNLDNLVSFWSAKLGVEQEKISSIIDNPPELQEMMRSKLMKYGAVGYVKPERGNFPALEEMIDMIKDTDALPVSAWLDGTNEGEKNIKEFLQLMVEKGIAVLNIIPERNWNIRDKKEKEIKVKHLDEVIKIAEELDLPIVVGTEMNKYGQRFIDDFTVPELKPYLDCFRKGAFFVYGHTRMGQTFNKGYNSQWANGYLPTKREKNSFYTKVGKLMKPEYDYKDIKIKDNAKPDEIYKKIGDTIYL
ncbi:MAG: hypothetical protein AUJ85_09210 [Elusimicrobia bacterium CG1_02_37_114]|nr:MAG: hypothetical protein AUJ85_09210 [Elusimicrobia bacterium CG1_02_37_114]PIV53292.1 MAG: hypothetical protein COS17_04705 [Elusimicrobia bacterium CG02_land_8_20_14_3_00_37_13]PIZ12438.1 MAG: hypothetical protein COY53_10030 [Elusimicrobia bacterium CG_4_10_14_0_8_um_filter_37_32]